MRQYCQFLNGTSINGDGVADSDGDAGGSFAVVVVMARVTRMVMARVTRVVMARVVVLWW